MGAGASTAEKANSVSVTPAAPTKPGTPAAPTKETYAAREQNPVEHAVKEYGKDSHGMLSKLAAAEQTDEHAVPELQGAIFCGHLVADLDSVAGAIGAAELYGGVAVRAALAPVTLSDAHSAVRHTATTTQDSAAHCCLTLHCCRTTQHHTHHHT